MKTDTYEAWLKANANAQEWVKALFKKTKDNKPAHPRSR